MAETHSYVVWIGTNPRVFFLSRPGFLQCVWGRVRTQDLWLNWKRSLLFHPSPRWYKSESLCKLNIFNWKLIIKISFICTPIYREKGGEDLLKSKGVLIFILLINKFLQNLKLNRVNNIVIHTHQILDYLDIYSIIHKYVI